MADIEINRARIAAVVSTAVHATAKEVKGLHPIEAIIGFSEVLGRAIAVQNVSFIEHQKLLEVATTHMIATVKASYSAQGKDSAPFN